MIPLKHLTSLTVFLSCMLILSCGKQRKPAESPDINQRMRAVLMVDANTSPSLAVTNRIVEGLNIQTLIMIDKNSQVNGKDLLDPSSVDVRWNDNALDSFVYYKDPALAIVFTLLPREALLQSPKGELSFRSSFVGSDLVDSGWRLPIKLNEEDLSRLKEDLSANGKRVWVKAEEGPVESASYFGQRRRDLYTESNSEGIVYLNAAARNAPGDHYVWKDQYWTTRFDPISSPTITLRPKSPENIRKVTLLLEGADGRLIEEAIIRVADNYYHHYTISNNVIDLPADQFDRINVLHPDYNGKSIEVQRDVSEMILSPESEGKLSLMRSEID